MNDSGTIVVDPMANLIASIKAGDAETVEAILARDPSLVNAADKDGLTAIVIAMYYGQAAIASLLASRGAVLDIFSAAARGDLARLRALLDDDPTQINTYSPDGWTPLALAAFFGHAAAIEFLLEGGADFNAKSRNAMGNLPIHAAAAGGHTAAVAALLAGGADVNAVDDRGWTPLALASQNGSQEIVEVCLAHEANVDALSADGRNALDLAMAAGHEGIVELLRASSASRPHPPPPSPETTARERGRHAL